MARRLGSAAGLQNYIWTLKKHPKNWVPAGFAKNQSEIANIVTGKQTDNLDTSAGTRIEVPPVGGSESTES